MIYSVQQIKFEVLSYIKECGTDFGAWYIGIASHPKTVMQDRHGVDVELDVWFCKQAMSFRACDTIRSYFVRTLGVDGERESGSTEGGNCIYLFRKSERTRPASSVVESSIVTADRSE